MNVVFITVIRFDNIYDHNIYTDLMRKFRDEGHNVYIVFPRERRYKEQTLFEKKDGVNYLGVKTLNIQKTHFLEKGLGTLLFESQMTSAIKRYLSDVKFDLILYSTPPVTYTKILTYLKSNNPEATTYLLLKDIFPQNAVDLGLFSKKSQFYKLFRKKEKQLYELSDFIGCTSQGNINFIIRNNPDVDPRKLELAPNSSDIPQEEPNASENKEIRIKYGLPLNKTIFVYGGNLGVPQGIPFLIKCLEANEHRKDCHFVIVGNGTEYSKLENWISETTPQNVSLFKRLPKADYDTLVRASDIGMIFLNFNFTVPNTPCRMLNYIIEKKPIVAATDMGTDLGEIISSGNFGFWAPSNDVDAFTKVIDQILNSDYKQMGEEGYKFFLNNYTTNHTYSAIVKHIHS